MSAPRQLLALAACLTVCIVLGVGCTSSPTASPRPSAKVSAVPTSACDPYTSEVTRAVIIAFLNAYNVGASVITDRFIAPAEQFRWYGAPGRQYPDDPASADRRTLPAYFAAQHAQDDRLELKAFSYSGISYSENTGYANFGYTLIHTVAGGGAQEAPGKGALACASGRIAIWRISSW